jgi:integrase
MAQKARQRGAKGKGSVFFDRSANRYVAQFYIDDEVIGTEVVGDEARKITKRRYLKSKHKTEKEAVDALNRMIADHSMGRTITAKAQSLGDWLDEWLQETIRPNREPKTVEYYDTYIRIYIKPALGKRDLRKVDAPAIAALIAHWQKQGKRYDTLRGIRNTLRSAYATAVKYGLVYDNPVTRTNPPKAPDKAVRFLTREEAAKLLEALQGDPAETLVRFGLATGVRIGEALGLTWAQVDLLKKEIRIEGQLQRTEKEHRLKSLKSPSARRPLPLTDDAVAAIRAEEDRQGMSKLTNPFGLVFLNVDGKPWHKRNVGERLDEACWRADIPLVTFHTLRHSAATFMLMDGVPLHTVSKWLGHANIALTSQLYGHVLADSLREAANILQRAYLGDGKG